MSKALLLISTFLFALPSCDSTHGDHHGEKATTDARVSTAIVQILPSSLVLADPAIRTDNFIANEIASISMGEVLEKASHKGKWADLKADLNRIKNSLKVTRIEGTDMAKITVASSEKISGKKIINDLIDAYLEIREDFEFSTSHATLVALDNELIAQSNLVQDHRKELTVLIQQYGIPYFDHTPNPLGKAELELYTEARKDLAALQSKAAMAKAQLQVAGDDEATRKKLTAQIKLLDLQFEALAKITDERQDDSISLALKQSNYTSAKDQYEQAVALLHKMKMKQQETRVALPMPLNAMIVRQKPH